MLAKFSKFELCRAMCSDMIVLKSITAEFLITASILVAAPGKVLHGFAIESKDQNVL